MSYRSVLLATLSTALGLAVVEASDAWSAFSWPQADTAAAPKAVEVPEGYLSARVERILRTDHGPVILLNPEGREAFLPIWIAYPEARAILRAKQGFDPPRPMTHDLFAVTLAELDAQLAHVRVERLRGDGVYIGTLALSTPQGPMEIDARPSDAIALALRSGATIYVAEKLSKHMLSTAAAE